MQEKTPRPRGRFPETRQMTRSRLVRCRVRKLDQRAMLQVKTEPEMEASVLLVLALCVLGLLTVR
jgi:hypothetical protein